MLENYSLNYDLLVRKLQVVAYLKKSCELHYDDIAHIVISEPEIIETYCINLLNLN